MILTGEEIKKSIISEDIVIEPFSNKQLNPNSYNYRLGNYLKEFVEIKDDKLIFQKIKIPEQGLLLKPNTLYLGNTFEILGSKKYAMSLIGKSSIGRLGIYVQISANLGHTTSLHKWTLEIYVLKPIIIYPNMIFGQISFWENLGRIDEYTGEYTKQNIPFESQIQL